MRIDLNVPAERAQQPTQELGTWAPRESERPRSEIFHTVLEGACIELPDGRVFEVLRAADVAMDRWEELAAALAELPDSPFDRVGSFVHVAYHRAMYASWCGSLPLGCCIDARRVR